MEPARPPLTGIGQYTKRLVHGLALHADVNNIFSFCGGRFESIGMISEPTEQWSKARSFARRIPKARNVRDALVNYRFKRQYKKLSEHFSKLVYLEPGYVLKSFEGPAVPIIYDLSNIICPGYHPTDRVKYLNAKIPKALAHATRVVTISEFIKKQIVEVYGVNEDIIDVVYPVIDSTFFPRSKDEMVSTLERYNISPGYFLAVGTIEPRKNLKGLIEAFKRLPKKIRVAHPLVIIGGQGWKCNLHSKPISMLERAGEIRFLGYVMQEDMPFLYSGASALVYPSFYEGFGMPIAEAMTCGVPVITSNCSAMPETAGDGALLVDPHDIAGLTVALRQILSDKALHDVLTKNSLNVSKKYTLSNAVMAMVQTLHSATDNNI